MMVLPVDKEQCVKSGKLMFIFLLCYFMVADLIIVRIPSHGPI